MQPVGNRSGECEIFSNYPRVLVKMLGVKATALGMDKKFLVFRNCFRLYSLTRQFTTISTAWFLFRSYENSI